MLENFAKLIKLNELFVGGGRKKKSGAVSLSTGVISGESLSKALVLWKSSKLAELLSGDDGCESVARRGRSINNRLLIGAAVAAALSLCLTCKNRNTAIWSLLQTDQ